MGLIAMPNARLPVDVICGSGTPGVHVGFTVGSTGPLEIIGLLDLVFVEKGQAVLK